MPPHLIPDYLALVGDTADGYPGIPGWGARSTAAVLNRHGHLKTLPVDDSTWKPDIAGGASLARNLRESWKDALVFLELATLRTDATLFESVESLEWKGPRPAAIRIADRIGASGLLERAQRRPA